MKFSVAIVAAPVSRVPNVNWFRAQTTESRQYTSADDENPPLDLHKKKQSIGDHMKGTIITFDVGGQIYRVSKDLLTRFPNTMLYATVSDVTESNDDDPIFIERNGNRFQYILDYMLYAQGQHVRVTK
jgi:BTB/POZ domain